mmetsp:Transcript_61321/g.109058  ORF Transcript_61321/g.109058 Transcript_61321/m.109058 type:complete len:225 (+) Transcript_61321:568-1242(+)
MLTPLLDSHLHKRVLLACSVLQKLKCHIVRRSLPTTSVVDPGCRLRPIVPIKLVLDGSGELFQRKCAMHQGMIHLEPGMSPGGTTQQVVGLFGPGHRQWTTSLLVQAMSQEMRNIVRIQEVLDWSGLPVICLFMNRPACCTCVPWRLVDHHNSIALPLNVWLAGRLHRYGFICSFLPISSRLFHWSFLFLCLRGLLLHADWALLPLDLLPALLFLLFLPCLLRL